MRFVMIACLIDDNKNKIGLRLLNVESGMFKDIDINMVKNGILKGTTVENLKLVDMDGEDIGIDEYSKYNYKQVLIVGSNGVLGRYTQLKNGEPQGNESPLVVLSKIGNIGYVVSDYKGKILRLRTKDVIEYANKNGIANGSVYSRDNGTEYIASISGSYVTDGSTIRNNEKYIGEYISKPRVRGYYVIVNKSNKLLNYYANNAYTGVIYSIPEDIKDSDIGIRKINNCSTEKGLVRELNIEKDREEFKELLEKHDLINKIDKYCSTIHKNVSKNTEIRIYVDRNKDKSNNKVTEDIVDEYINKIKEVKRKNPFYGNIHVIRELNEGKDIIVNRIINKDGIQYNVYNGYTVDAKVMLEDIYDNIDKYLNVKVDKDGKLIIEGLDAVYKYDVERYKKEYKRDIIQTKKAIKAKIIGKNYTEKINEAGVLLEFRTDFETIEIPKEVKYIERNAIDLTKDNKRLILGENIKDVKAKFMKMNGILPLRYIEIGCNTKVMTKLFRLLDEYMNAVYLSGKKINVKFNRDVNAKDIALILDMQDRFNSYINLSLYKEIEYTDEFIRDIVSNLKIGDTSSYNKIKLGYKVDSIMSGIEKLGIGVTPEIKIKIKDAILK